MKIGHNCSSGSLLYLCYAENVNATAHYTFIAMLRRPVTSTPSLTPRPPRCPLPLVHRTVAACPAPTARACWRPARHCHGGTTPTNAKNHYSRLGLVPPLRYELDGAELKQRYQALQRDHHPDVLAASGRGGPEALAAAQGEVKCLCARMHHPHAHMCFCRQPARSFTLLFVHVLAACVLHSRLPCTRADVVLVCCVRVCGAAGGAAESAQINLSYMTLADPLRRAEYGAPFASDTPCLWAAQTNVLKGLCAVA